MGLTKYFSHIRFLVGLLILSALVSCRPSRSLTTNERSLDQFIETNEVFQEGFSGFVLYDPSEKAILLNKNGHKYFTPASNTKIATLLASMEILGDSLPLLEFAYHRDTLFFRGTGDPLNLNPYIQNNSNTIDWLKRHEDKKLVYVPQTNKPVKFGSGWAWDDYLHYYQLENNDFPIYGNQISISGSIEEAIIYPEIFSKFFDIRKNETSDISRSFEANDYKIYLDQENLDEILPISISDSLIAQLLADTLKTDVGLGYSDTLNLNWKKLHIPFEDSLYVQLMHASDNFIAEQLLLMSAYKISDTLSRELAIKHSVDHWEPFLMDTLRWVDGSGLSRYNLFTPYIYTQLLDRILEQRSWDWIRGVFPQGANSGTIKNFYFQEVYAKTGSLSNNHNLSGFIETKKGRVLIFSFMHNHFLSSSSDYKREMESLLRLIHEMY